MLPDIGGLQYLERLATPIERFARMEYGDIEEMIEEAGDEEKEAVVDPKVPKVLLAKVKRKRYLRGDVRYVFRKTCGFLHLTPRGVFMRL